VRTLPRDAVKVLLGDNLAAHLSPYVLKMCEVYNIRYRYNIGSYRIVGYLPVPRYLYSIRVRYQYLPECHLYLRISLFFQVCVSARK
jgi:hypothetical protein